MSKLERMDHVDAAFFGVDSDATPQVIAALCMLDEPPDLATIQARVTGALAHFPRLKQKAVVRPYLAWQEDPDFQVSNHVDVIRVPGLLQESELLAEVDRLIRATPSPERPPWRLVVITNDRDHSCLLFCLHHALADGVRVVSFLEALSSETRDSATSTDTAGDQAISPPSHSLLEKLVYAARCSRKLVSEKLKSPGPSPLNGDNSGQRCVTLFDFPRADLIRIMRHFGGSVHDVVYTLVAGTVRRVHDDCGAPNEDLRLVVPMSVPPTSNKGGLGNHLVISALTLPVSEPDVTRRLQRVQEVFQRMKSDGTIGAYAFVAKAIHRLIPRRFQRRIWDSLLRQTNFLCTVLLGAETTRYIGGARIERIYGLPAPVVGHGVAFSFVSYAGTVSAAIVYDANIVNHPAALKEHLESEFRAMLTLAGGESTFVHPLLGRTLFASAGESLFESKLNLDSAPYLAQHRVYGDPILPTGALLEMTLAAVAQAVPHATPAIENMTFDRPLKLSPDVGHKLHTTVIPEHDGAFSFQISSHDENQADVWIQHAEAWIETSPETSGGLQPGNLADLQADCTQPVDVATFYQCGRQRKAEYGPDLQGLRGLWRGPAQALAEITLPPGAAQEAVDHQMHPALIEACLQVAMVAASNGESECPMLPWRIERLRVFQRPGSVLWAHAKVRDAPGDPAVDLLAIHPDGGMVASIEGLRLREIDESAVTPSADEKVEFGRQWRATENRERYGFVASHVRAQVGRVLGCSTTRHIRADDRLVDLGIDSMMATELKTRLETSLGQPLPPNVVFECPTVGALVDFLVARLTSVGTQDVVSNP